MCQPEVVNKNNEEYTDAGRVSIALGVAGILGYLFIGLIAGLPFGIISVILGRSARKQGDKSGTYGIILGIIVIIPGIVTLTAAILYFYITSMSPLI